MKKLAQRFARLNPVKRFMRAQPVSRFAGTLTLAILSMLVIPLVQAHPASAANVLACPPTNIGFNSVPNTFCVATGDWLMRAQNLAQGFFFSLVAVEMAWSTILYLLQKDNLGELLTSWLLKIMAICFFYAIILNANIWLPAILNSFIALGNQVTNQNVPLDPEHIFETGLAFCNAVFTNLPQTQFPGWEGLTNIGGTITDNLTVVFEMLVSVVFAAIVCLVIFASFIVVAGQLLMTLIEAYIMISAGAVMLGFMGSRWTMSWGEKYIGYAVSVGIKLFVTFVILGLGETLFQGWAGILSAINGIVFNGPGSIGQLAPLVQDYLSIAAAAVIYLMLVIKLPGLASSMLNGSPSLSFGGAASTAGAVAGAVTGIAAGVASAVGGALSKGGSAVSALKDASAVDDKLGALANQGAAGAIGDAAADAALDSATDNPTDALGDASDLGGVTDGLGDGDTDQPLGGPDALGGSEGELEDQLALEAEDDISEDAPLLGVSNSGTNGSSTLSTSDQNSALNALSDASGLSDVGGDAFSLNGGPSGNGASGGKDSQLVSANRAARDSALKGEKSGLERELAHADSRAQKATAGAFKSLANGASAAVSSGSRLVTNLDEGNGAGGAAQISLKMPD